jgi:hypothetical protein
VPESEVWLRLTPTKNHQQARIRYAKEHTLAVWATSVRAPKNGLDRLERHADAVAQQQRRAIPGTGTDRDAQRLLADRHQAGPVRYAGHGA